MKRLLALCLILCIFISCNSTTEYQHIKIRNKFSLDLPTHMSEVKNLNAQASLQYQNGLKEQYIIVLDEPKTDFPNPNEVNLEDYFALLKENLEASIEKSTFSPVTDTIINGLKAKRFTVSGKTKGLEIYYEFAFYESKQHFYQVMTWTLLDRKDEFIQEMNTIITSFKEARGRGK